MSRLDEIQARIDARMEEIDQRVGNGRLEEIQRKADSRLEEIARRIDGGDCPQGSAAAGGSVRSSAAPSAGFAKDAGPYCRRIGLSIGLSKYKQTNDCPGCVVDATDFAAILRGAGFETTLLCDAQATRERVTGAIADANSKLMPGDLFVVAVSGHGARGDVMNPATGRMETHEGWCLYDGELYDAVLVPLFEAFKPGVRIVVINDQCHAGGMFTVPGVAAAPQAVALGFGWARSWYGTSATAPSLIQLAACRAEQTSIGNPIGGTWITALMKVLAVSREISWREWFDKAASHLTLGPGQTPQWVELGPVTELFRQGRVLV